MSTICVNCGTESETSVCGACHQRINEGKVFVGNLNAAFKINKRPVKNVVFQLDELAEDGQYWKELLGESHQ